MKLQLPRDGPQIILGKAECEIVSELNQAFSSASERALPQMLLARFECEIVCVPSQASPNVPMPEAMCPGPVGRRLVSLLLNVNARPRSAVLLQCQRCFAKACSTINSSPATLPFFVVPESESFQLPAQPLSVRLRGRFRPLLVVGAAAVGWEVGGGG